VTDNQGTNLTKLYAAVWNYLEDYAPGEYELEIAVEVIMDRIVDMGYYFFDEKDDYELA
jgi:hypothetical protein